MTARAVLAVAAALAALVPGAPRAAPCAEELVRRARPMMATIVTVTARGCPERLEEPIRRAFAEMERVAGLLSEWSPESPISQVGRSAGIAPVPVPPEVLDLLERAAAISARTDGRFDVTWAALRDLWRFGPERPAHLPAAEEVVRQRSLVGWHDLVLDRVAGTAFLRRSGMRLGLGGIAKGYVAEAGAEALVAAGVRDVLVAASGDVCARGKNGDRPWTVAIRDPRRPSAVLGTVELHDESISTSGDYEQFFEVEGRRYHHILDPATGWPATASESATVVARRGADADGLATGLFVLGPERAGALLAGDPDVSAVLVGSDGRVRVAGAPRPIRLADPGKGCPPPGALN